MSQMVAAQSPGSPAAWPSVCAAVGTMKSRFTVISGSAMDREFQLLITALSLARRIESEHNALPRLAALATAHTSTCLTALEAWARTSPHPWTLQQQEESIRAILKTGIASGDPAVGETATAIVSLCITAGIDLRDTLTGDQ